MFKIATLLIVLVCHVLPASADDAAAAVYVLRWNGQNPNPATRLVYDQKGGIYAKASAFITVLGNVFNQNIKANIDDTIDNLIRAGSKGTIGELADILDQSVTIDQAQEEGLASFRKTKEGREFFSAIESNQEPMDPNLRKSFHEAKLKWRYFRLYKQSTVAGYASGNQSRLLAVSKFLRTAFENSQIPNSAEGSMIEKAFKSAAHWDQYLDPQNTLMHEPYRGLHAVMLAASSENLNPRPTPEDARLALRMIGKIYPQERAGEILRAIQQDAANLSPAVQSALNAEIGQAGPFAKFTKFSTGNSCSSTIRSFFGKLTGN